MKKKILFIEDDYMTIENAVLHLELSGNKVIVCDTPTAAITHLRYDKFNTIFVDVMLPPGDLFTLTDTAEGRYTGLRLIEFIFSDIKFLNAQKSSWYLITNWRDEPEVESVALKYNIAILRKPLLIKTIEGVISVGY